MKISNSKKELARIISENGGWLCADFAAQQDDGEVWFSSKRPEWNTGRGIFSMSYEDHFTIGTLINNRHQCILSREEYFHLYPAPDADGWIEWKGGECPVDGECIVSYKMRDAATFMRGEPASEVRWQHNGTASDIIAYRLHKPEQAKPEFCESVTRSIPEPESNPTIEQLAADYRNRKDYADRKQKEADAAKADAEAKLAELVAAGKALNLVISVADEEPELVITDWRDLKVDDVISVQCFEKVYSQSTVLAVGVSDVLIRNHVGAIKTVNLDERDWSFIRRP